MTSGWLTMEAPQDLVQAKMSIQKNLSVQRVLCFRLIESRVSCNFSYVVNVRGGGAHSGQGGYLNYQD